MPDILERLVSQLQAKGMDKKKAYAVAVSSMQKAGNIDKHGKLTEKGKKRSKMTPAQRAKDREAKKRGGKTSDYKYNKYNNSAVKGKVNRNVKKRK